MPDNKPMADAGLYATLGIDPAASESEVRAAFLKKAREIHPDKVKQEDRGDATIKFQAITEMHCWHWPTALPDVCT